MGNFTVEGKIEHAAGVWGPAVGCRGSVTIWDGDAGTGRDDLIFHIDRADADGAFHGSTSRDWYDPRRNRWGFPTENDVPWFTLVVHDGEHQHHVVLPAPGPGLPLILPPIAVPWAPDSRVLAPRACASDPLNQLRMKRDRALYQWSHPPELDPAATCRGVPPPELWPKRYADERAALKGRQNANKVELATQWAGDPFDRFDDYAKMYPAYKRRPETVARPYVLDDDAEFARQRLQGVNPLMLTLLDKPLPADCAFANAHLTPFFGRSDGLEWGRANRRLFLCDYGELVGVQAQADRFVAAPFALFALLDVDGGTRNKLAPVAIQVERGAGSPVFTYDMGETWRVAKLVVQLADGLLHELKYHLWGAHFAMEPWVVAMHRNLGDCHALKVLLKRHCVAMIVNDNIGQQTLTNAGGYVEQLLAPTWDASLGVSSSVAPAWRFRETEFRAHLQRRGVFDVSVLPEYPYRDDGILVCEAIHRFVSRYVARYYPDDARVADDPQLAAFLKDVTSSKGGRLKGVPDIQTRDALSDLVTAILFNWSAYHAAVNYPQWEYMAYVANMPLALYAEPFDGTGAPRPLMDLLPPRAEAQTQVDLFWELTSYRFDRLGHYRDPFEDSVAEDLAVDFRTDLAKVGQIIDERNAKRAVPYPYLHPARIPNGASV
jgi:arachidonate 15-lipoxygenase